MDKILEESIRKHAEWKGKIETVCRVPVDSREALMLAYTPGVAGPCLEIQAHPEKSFTLTRRWNTVPVITDGTAILGLGNIGPEAGMPVMEGKCALFKAYADVDAFPLCLHTTDTEDIIHTIKNIAGSFGGINLEDISAPRCFEIEKRLQEELDIPVFHDDQHGTAIIVAAALLNALKLVKKDIHKIKVVISGAGAAGVGICRLLTSMGVTNIILTSSHGILEDDPRFNPTQRELSKTTNPEKIHGSLADAMKGADVFIGVSVKDIVSQDMVRSMAEKPILFPCANPYPEINPNDALKAGACIVGSGSSQYPNQINNVLVFPGLFRGALDAKATKVNDAMLLAAAEGIAACVSDDELRPEYILPYAYDKRVHQIVAAKVKEAAIRSGDIRPQ